MRSDRIGRRALLACALVSLLGRSGRPALWRCSLCSELAGRAPFASTGRVVRVRCRCGNDTVCRRCQRPLAERRVAAYFWNESEGRVWHMPGLAALAHRCTTGGP